MCFVLHRFVGKTVILYISYRYYDATSSRTLAIPLRHRAIIMACPLFSLIISPLLSLSSLLSLPRFNDAILLLALSFV